MYKYIAKIRLVNFDGLYDNYHNYHKVRLFTKVKNKINKFTFLTPAEINNKLFLKATLFAIRNRLKLTTLDEIYEYDDIKLLYLLLENKKGIYLATAHYVDEHYIWRTLNPLQIKPNYKHLLFNRIRNYVNKLKI